MIVVCGLSLIQSGLCNNCVNRTGDPGATGNQVLLRNLLNMDYFSFIAELQIIAQEVRHRAHETTFYELDLSSQEAFTAKNEPVDERDFTEF